jgi:hypothetical protein
MTQVLIVAAPDTSNDRVIVTVSGQNIPIGEGTLLKLEQPGPFQLSGTSGLDSAYVVCMQSDNYQLTGKLVEVESAAGSGGGTTYTADGVTLQLIGTTFSIKNNGVGAAQLANAAVGVNQLSSAVAGNGLSGGSGLALAVNVDNTTVEAPFGTLQVKTLGIGSGQLATSAVTSNKIATAAVDYSKMGGGTERVPLNSTQVLLEATGQPNPGDSITLWVTDQFGLASPTFEANGAGPYDFAIGASAADTLNNLIIAMLAYFATSRSQLKVLPNTAGDAALLSVNDANPTSAVPLSVVVNASSLTNYLYSTPQMLVQDASRKRSVYCFLLQISAADVTRGYVAFRGDTNNDFTTASTVPWVLARSSFPGVMKALGANIEYDNVMQAWTITNNGTNDFAINDELLIYNILDT